MKRYWLIVLLAVAATRLIFGPSQVAWADPGAQGAVTRRLPRPSDRLGPAGLPDLCSLAGQHEARGEYRRACQLYEQLLLGSNVPLAVRLRAQRCAVHARLAHRYRDPSFTALLSQHTPAQAYQWVRRVWAKTHRYYVEAISYGRLVDLGLVDLEVACENAPFQQAHPSVASADREVFVDRVRRLRASLAGTPLTLQQALGVVEHVCSVARADLELDGPAVAMEMLFGSVESLDDYTDLLTPNEITEVYSLVDGKFVGIGLEVEVVAFGLLVVMPLAGSPAEAQQIQPGDLIVAVDGASAIGWTPEKAGAALQGRAGSSVDLDIVGRGDTAKRRVRMQRRHLAIQSVRCARLVDPAHHIGYIHLSGFQKTTARELDQALARLERQGLRALVLDVRGNPGGLVQASVEVADRFLAGGVIVSTRGRAWDQNWIHRAHVTATRTQLPLVVLMDHRSASASEILAGAIRDHRRGPLVGARSYGKGNVQSVYDLPDLPLGLRLTTAKYYSPRGECFSRTGIQPDVAVALAPRAAFGCMAHDSRRRGTVPDTQLARAVAILAEGLPPRVSRR